MYNFKNWLFWLALLALLLSTAAALYYLKEAELLRSTVKEQRHFIQDNNTAFRVADSLNALEVVTNRMRQREFKQQAEKNAALLEDMGVSIKRVTSQASLNLRGVYRINTRVYDSVVVDSLHVLDTIKCIYLDEQYLHVNGCIEEGAFVGAVHTVDSLVYIEHITPRKFLFIKWGVKERRQTILNLNKDSQVVSAQFVTKET